jgi:fucose 4-O-acetylase-like acetyltransferase
MGKADSGSEGLGPRIPRALSGFLHDRDLLDTAKGILMLAIALGHNRILTDAIPDLFVLLYFWHVQGFFFLAFSNRGFVIESRRTVDAMVRYLTPFILLTGLLVLALLVASRRPELVVDWLALLYSGAADRAGNIIGIQLFWFLPTFTSFVIAQIWLSRLLRRIGGIGWPAAAFFTAIAVVAAWSLPTGVQLALPWCAGLAVYLLALSVAFAAFCDPLLHGNRLVRIAVGVIGAVTTGATAWLVVSGHPINVALFHFGNPLIIALLAASGAIGANLLVVLASRRLGGSALLKTIGRNSLQIYLFHIFVEYGAWIAFRRIAPNHPMFLSLITGLLVTGLAVGISIAAAKLIRRISPINAILFPKDLASLKAVLLRGGTRPA